MAFPALAPGTLYLIDNKNKHPPHNVLMPYYICRSDMHMFRHQLYPNQILRER